MIMEKNSAHSATGWLSSREIHQRGYYKGELSSRNLLAHTCCHEFAHLLQQVDGKRFRGSVHNRHFYRILDELHASGAAQSVRERLCLRADEQGLTLPDSVFQPDVLDPPSDQWRVGDPVTFGQPPRHHHGHIIRVNRKTCTVAGAGRSQGLHYRVPVTMLRSSVSRHSSTKPAR